MVLLIRVVSLKGRPPGQELSARFEESGGTIGRGTDNSLVLPDPERYISRTHAIVSFQAGGFVLTDKGTKNPVTLNGRPLGPGSQARLGEGDTIQIGDYILEVSAPSRAAPQTPTPATVAKRDPIVAVGSKGSDPFADLMAPKRAQSPPVAAPPMWPQPPQRPSEPAPLSSDPLPGLRPSEPHIDEILGVKTPPADPFAVGPSPGSPGSLLGQPTPVLPSDPFENWPASAKASRPPAIPDHTPELNLPFFPPQPRTDPVLSPPTSTPPVLPISVIPSPPSEPPPALAPAALDELLRAFLRGAGIPDAKIPAGMTPEMMESLGRIIHEAVKGTIDLLRARATTKGEMRADVTMITAMDNNPLKFSPSAEAALVHLLAPSVPGFTSPLRAMKEAYDDLRAHQLGFLAGMRAALDEVLARFEPQGLEERLADPGLLDSLMPMNRKARLWDLFVDRYTDVAADAREDFHAAFGKAFLRAYNEQVKRLRAEDRRG